MNEVRLVQIEAANGGLFALDQEGRLWFRSEGGMWTQISAPIVYQATS